MWVLDFLKLNESPGLKPVCGHVQSVLEVHSMKYFALELCVHVLNLPALLLLLSLLVQRV